MYKMTIVNSKGVQVMALTVLILFCVALGIVGGMAISALTPSTVVMAQPAPSVTGYKLSEYNGSIGIFKDGAEVPVNVVDIDVDLLRAYDRESLQRGIWVDTEADVWALIEDFGS